MELLLFLTAMLAGLLSGDRAVDARQVGQAAVAAAAIEAVAVLAEEAEEQAVATAAPRLAPSASSAPMSAGRTLRPALAPVDERRLE